MMLPIILPVLLIYFMKPEPINQTKTIFRNSKNET